MFSEVTRVRPAGDPGAGDQATLTSVVYGIPTSGTCLPDLSAGGVAEWGQAKVPTYGAAVFGPEHPAPASPDAGDWPYADLHFTDDLGYTVNTASFGAGAWQIAATNYNAKGNITHQWDPAPPARSRPSRRPTRTRAWTRWSTPRSPSTTRTSRTPPARRS